MKKVVFLVSIALLALACNTNKWNELELRYEPLAQQIDRCGFNDINPIIFTDYAISADLIGLKSKVEYKLFSYSGKNVDSLLITMANEGYRQASFTELLVFHQQKKFDFPTVTPVLALGEWRRLRDEKYYPGAYGEKLNVYRIIDKDPKTSKDPKTGNDVHDTWIVLGIKKYKTN